MPAVRLRPQEGSHGTPAASLKGLRVGPGPSRDPSARPTDGGNLLAADFAAQAFHVAPDGRVLGQQLLDLADRVEHGRVVLAAEVASEFLEGGSREFAAEVDADLPGLGRGLGPAPRVQVAHLLVEVAGDNLLDL